MEELEFKKGEDVCLRNNKKKIYTKSKLPTQI